MTQATKVAHTPGPWSIAPGNFIVSPEGDIVAEVPCQGANGADLLLIAAAPELLEALKWAVSLINGCEWGSTLNSAEDEELTKAEAAIQKAEGGHNA